jgi:hypothetical protein
MRFDVRSKDHHGDLLIAAVGRPSGRIEVGRLEGWFCVTCSVY